MKYQGEQVQPEEPLAPVEPIADIVPMGDTVYALRFKDHLSPETRERLSQSAKMLNLPFRIIILDREVEIFKLTK
jgi:hypothetical protein